MYLQYSFVVALITAVCVNEGNAKIFTSEEFAKELRRNGIPEGQIKTWTCIAKHESNFNTAAHNTDTGDHGILQISELFWCSPPGKGCGVTCASLRNSDITNDIKCAKLIKKEHDKIDKNGNGFTAWVAYKYCKNL